MALGQGLLNYNDDFSALTNSQTASLNAQRQAAEEESKAKRCGLILCAFGFNLILSSTLAIAVLQIGAALLDNQEYLGAKGVRTSAIMVAVGSLGFFTARLLLQRLRTIGEKATTTQESRERAQAEATAENMEQLNADEEQLQAAQCKAFKTECKILPFKIVIAAAAFFTALYPFGDMEDAVDVFKMNLAGTATMIPLACCIACCIEVCKYSQQQAAQQDNGTIDIGYAQLPGDDGATPSRTPRP